MREPVCASRLANCIANTELGSTIYLVQTPDEPVRSPAWMINDRLLIKGFHHRKHTASRDLLKVSQTARCLWPAPTLPLIVHYCALPFCSAVERYRASWDIEVGDR